MTRRQMYKLEEKEATGPIAAHYSDKLIELEHEIMVFGDLEGEMVADVHSQLSYLNSSIGDMKAEMERRLLIEEIESFKEDESYISDRREEYKEAGVAKKDQKTDEQLISEYTIKFPKKIQKKFEKAAELLKTLIPKDHVKMWLNTRGGLVTGTLALIDQIESMDYPVHITGTGQIASAGILLLASGAKGHRGATARTIFMTHAGGSGAEGATEEIGIHYALSTKLDDLCKTLTLEKTKMSSKQYDKIHRIPSYYFGAEEALKLGIIDFIVGAK